MTVGGDPPPDLDPAGPRRRPPVLGWRARLEGLQRTVMRTPLMAAGLEVSRAYDRAGGAMLSGALAYFAFFTMVPTLLLFTGLLGVLVEDATLREQLVQALVEQVDPIRDVAISVLDGLADSGRTGTIIGVLGLMWGASGFYGALDGAMQRMFPGTGSRDFLRVRARGVVTVVVVLGVLLLAVLLMFGLPLLTRWFEDRCGTLATLQWPVIDVICGIDVVQVTGAIAVVGAMGVAFLAALMVYVVVPTEGPSVRQAFWPAVIVGIVIGALTSFFGWIAPFIARIWLTLGIVGSIFIALIWFNLVFQALLYGAAFTRLRRDRDRRRAGPPRW